jgi:hypothetical protein
MASILVGRLPGRLQTISIEEGATVESVLKQLESQFFPATVFLSLALKSISTTPLATAI